MNRKKLSLGLSNQTLLLLALVSSLAACLPSHADSAAKSGTTRRVWPQLLEPREHPDYHRRAVQPPSLDDFGRRTHFTSLRGFDVQGDRIVGIAQELDKYTRTHQLGDVIWPSYPILFATNLVELADEIKRRNLYLFDVWGYVPGSGPGGYWQQFKPRPEIFPLLEAHLGARWLGTDIGEQDGRYIGGYANQMTPASASRMEQYLNFQRHFERMSDDLGHKHSVLVSLNFGHYLLKEGTFTLIGAETAQGLPNSQVYYAFIRGAGKQYGVPWFGNASVWNRWGYKNYSGTGRSDGADYGPTKGTSLSLLQRLLYSHILYNCAAVGFESGWLDGDKLTPIGVIQQSAQRWVRQHGQPGTHYAPVALLLDFQSGWSFPRHLYSGDVYRVWGNLPYDQGDYLTDAVLDLLYPGYQNSSYFHDELGFQTATPYGDMTDCLLSDAPLWLLRRYAVLVVAGGISPSRELRDKLQAYVEQGGHLVITAGNLARLPGGLGGCTNPARNQTLRCGRGRITCFASPFGLERIKPESERIESKTDAVLVKPFRLEPRFQRSLEEIFRSQQLFEVNGTGLSFITCRKSAGEYIIGIANNTWRAQPFELKSRCGKIKSIEEWTIDPAAAQAVGFTPEVVDARQLGQNGPRQIAGGTVRVFAVQTAEAGVEEIPAEPITAGPQGRLLPLRQAHSIKEAVLTRPTFFEHFDGVCVDWRYVHEREKTALAAESGWLKRQGLRVVVDLSSGINLYPALRLMDNIHDDYNESLSTVQDVLEKMDTLPSKDLLLSLHRFPENNFSEQQSREALSAALQRIAKQAAEHSITVHLRLAFGKPPGQIAEALRWLDRVQAPNLKLALSTALLTEKQLPVDTKDRLKSAVGLWLIAGSRSDVSGHLWDAHQPFHLSPNPDALAGLLQLAPGVPAVFDGVYENADDEYVDAAAFAAAMERIHLK